MYSLDLTCPETELDSLSATLCEAGTVGIRELEGEDGKLLLIAGFVDAPSDELIASLSRFHPVCRKEEEIDWEERSRLAWPSREVGSRLYLALPWSNEATPDRRLRLIHTPGLACGTGDHPCTQLALRALERLVVPGSVVADIGTGSGMLATAASLLGARLVAAVDTEADAVRAATGDFGLNGVQPCVAVGSADALRSEYFDLVVANISGTVLLFILEELLRITKSDGYLILTGFTEDESKRLEPLFAGCEVLAGC